MQIDLSDSGCLTLLLSDDELASLGLSFEELDYQSPQTRRMLHALLQLARRETGYAPEGALLIEALPLDGGCLLLVTPERVAPPTGEWGTPTVFLIKGEDALLQIAAAWPSAGHRLGEGSSLYRIQTVPCGSDPSETAAPETATPADAASCFCLILYGSGDAPVLYECAEPVADGMAAAAWAAEHGKPVFIGDALPRLHRLVQGSAS